MYDLTAICRNEKCENFQHGFTKRDKKATYRDSNYRAQPRTDLACPLCRTWGQITSIVEVA